MTTTIDQPYATGLTRAGIERALAEAGKQTDALQASDLAMLEDFHSLGRLATAALIDLAQISESDRVLDAGTGIGGTARPREHDASFNKRRSDCAAGARPHAHRPLTGLSAICALLITRRHAR